MNRDTLFVRGHNTAFVYEQEITPESEDSSAIYVANLDNSHHYVLENSSAVIWEFLEKPISLTDLVQGIADIFQQAPNTVQPTIMKFLEEMESLGFIARA